MDYPLPTADEDGIERTRVLYRQKFGIELTPDQAKTVLEGVMQFVYLTEVEDALRPLREEIQRERGSASSEY